MSQPDAHLVERGLTQEVVFNGQFLRVRLDTVALPNGATAAREIVEHPGAAAIVPLLPDGRVLLVRQYRYAIQRTTLELPCGKLNPGEGAEAAAARELLEETGCAGRLRYLGCMFSSPGFTNEVLHLFAATELAEGAAQRDPDEFIDTQPLTLADALARVRSGEIVDAKTVAGLLWLHSFGTDSAQALPDGTRDDAAAS